MKKITSGAFIGLLLISAGSCIKIEDYPRTNLYDEEADVTRNYSLALDHVVVNDAVDGNGNGLLDAPEMATIEVYIKNNGPDPCLLTEGTVETVIDFAPPLYIYDYYIGGYSGLSFGSSSSLGYKVKYIDPGAVDFLSVDVSVPPASGPNEDCACFMILKDFDGHTSQIDFNIHIE